MFFIYYKDKYKYLLGLDSGKDVVRVIKSNLVYGYGEKFNYLFEIRFFFL